MKSLILVNFKTYEKGSGQSALKLAKAISSFRSDYWLAVSPQAIDLKGVCGLGVSVFAQHVDNISYGSHTGSVLPEAVKKAGAFGTLLNHSEKRIGLLEIRETVEKCKNLKLRTVVCASSLAMVKKIARFIPDYIAYEPKRLIGKNVSVTSTNPKVITKAVNMLSRTKTRLLAGAGVHSKKDIKKAIELGASGVLIAHKIVQAKDVKKVLRQMLG